MSSAKVEQVRDSVMNLIGKNIFHCHDTNSLFWCDVVSGSVLKMDLNNDNKLHMFKILGERVICFCVPVEGSQDEFIVGAGRRLLLVKWDGIHTLGEIIKVLAEITVEGVRFNMFKVDKAGRLFFGTMITEEEGDIFNMQRRIGGIYRFDMKDGLVQLKDKIGMGNGLAWNLDWTKFYFVDSFDLRISEFDYDIKTGNISNQNIFIDVSSYGQLKRVFPGGLAIDHEDNLFVTFFGGGKIMKINTKTKKIEQEIKLLVPQVTGCAFGGANFETLFATSCGLDFIGPQVYPSGYLMKITDLATKGVEMLKFKMN